MSFPFSPRRFLAMVRKEFVQMRRDRLTFAMMVGIPIMQTVLFGYAINTDPRHLPTAIVSADNSRFSRAVVQGMRNSDYFAVDRILDGRDQARELLRLGETQFVLTIPAGFGRSILRGERPVLLLEADATDPGATGAAGQAFTTIVSRAVDRELRGPHRSLVPGRPLVTVRVHADFNPENVTQYNIVPGLLGMVMTLTLVMITALAITREHERGTMENLLSTPVRPLEVMLGKILPYILVGYIQAALILTAARLLFGVPMHGSLVLLMGLTLVFIGANLSVGVTFSTLARNQLQAVQVSIFFFLPSLMLSGFMFPFRGMPGWAQTIGEVLPLTHYLRLVRGIVLKGIGPADTWPHVWPMLVFWLVVVVVGLKRYRKTLD